MSEEEKKQLDLREHGAPIDGNPQAMDRRLFIQLQVFTGVFNIDEVTSAFGNHNLDIAVYTDLHDPHGVGILFLSEEPDLFVTEIRSILNKSPFDKLERRPNMTMFGRSYAVGYEPDLDDALFGRPRRTALNPDWPWVVWYPLRRNGAFARLDHKEQRTILMEHATLGRTFGEADYAHDIRLACYGLDENDNDFVIGLLGKTLHPLSRVVQDMRKTQQTSLYIDSLGPFFIGKKIWQQEAEG